MNNEAEIRKDLLTGEEFIAKKSSQKFANRANGVKYNNLKAKELRELLKSFHEPMLKNFRFLTKKMADVNEKVFSTEHLAGAGYDLTKITHFYERGNISYPCLYNFMMIKINDREIKFEKL